MEFLGVAEESGDVIRSEAPGEGGARLVRATERGHAAYAKIIDILRDVERQWSAELGAERFAELKALLRRAWEGCFADDRRAL